MRTMLDPADRAQILSRLQTLTPDSRRRWGRMTAPQMVAHLTDQMRHTLGDVTCRPVPSLLSLSILRHAAIYWVPWPRGRVTGPPDAFVTQPSEWQTDLNSLVRLVERFGDRTVDSPWPPHALFGPMTGRDWGAFCYKHFNHHLSQFGA